MTGPPVAVYKIARRLGAEVRYESVERDICGMVCRQSDGSVVVGINSFHLANRQRFTLAHEPGHLCLHTKKNLYIDHIPRFRDIKSTRGVNPEEIEANLFAAELLMPESFLVNDIQSIEDEVITKEAIARLAKRYKVSPEAMRIRLERLRGVRFEV